MNTPKTIVLGLLLALASTTLGFAAHAKIHAAPWPARAVQTTAPDPAVASQIARAQAAVALSQSAGTASLPPFGF